MKDGTKVSIIYALALIPSIFSLIWAFSFIDLIYYPSDLTLPIVSIFTSVVFALLVYQFEPRIKHWRKAYCEFDENYVYEEAVD